MLTYGPANSSASIITTIFFIVVMMILCAGIVYEKITAIQKKTIQITPIIQDANINDESIP